MKPGIDAVLVYLAIVLGLRVALGTWIVWFRYDWFVGVTSPPRLLTSLVLLVLFGHPRFPKEVSFLKLALVFGWIVFLTVLCGVVTLPRGC